MRLGALCAIPLGCVVAAVVVLFVCSGMVACGVITDRVARDDLTRRSIAAGVFCVVAMVCLTVGFRLETGAAVDPDRCRRVRLRRVLRPDRGTGPQPHPPLGACLADGHGHRCQQSTRLALGPFVVGILADHIGLRAALQLSPLMYLAAIVALVVGTRHYPAGLGKLGELTASSAGTNGRGHRHA